MLDAICQHGGGPVGLKTIAVMVGEEDSTIEEVYEPYLIQQGYLLKTPRGRSVTPLACEKLGLPVRSGPRQAGLFDQGAR